MVQHTMPYELGPIRKIVLMINPQDKLLRNHSKIVSKTVACLIANLDIYDWEVRSLPGEKGLKASRHCRETPKQFSLQQS